MREIRLRTVRERDGGLEFRLAFRKGEAISDATARMLPSGEISELWIGDEVWLNDPDRDVPLALRPDLVGELTRKAEELNVLLAVRVR